MKRLLKFCFTIGCCAVLFWIASSNYQFCNNANGYIINSDNKNITVPQFDWSEDGLGISTDVTVDTTLLSSVDFSDCYAHSLLNEKEQQAYELIYEVLMSHTPTIHLNADVADRIDVIYQSVCADHGEIFWTDGYDYTYYKQSGEIIDIVFSPSYTYSVTERDKYQSIIEERLAVFLSGVTSDMTDYEKSKYIYDVLITNVSYNKKAEHNQNIVSVFVNGETVCRGYASAVQYMCSILGVESVIVDGLVGEEPHTWNLVKLDGKWYHLDVTWGNSKYKAGNNTVPYTDYNYLNVTQDSILQTHSIRKLFKLPVCDSTDNSYFVKENCIFYNYDETGIGELVSKCKKGDTLYLKFGDAAVYEMVINKLFIDKILFDYCKNGIKGYSYIEDTIHNTIVIVFN